MVIFHSFLYVYQRVYEKTMKINICIHDNGSTILFKPRKYKEIYGKKENYLCNKHWRCMSHNQTSKVFLCPVSLIKLPVVLNNFVVDW